MLNEPGGISAASPVRATRSAPRLLDRVRAAVRVRHYSRRTERAYVGWVRRFVLFHGRRHPSDMAAEEIRAFLNHLATTAKLSAATQNQALCAIVFLYKNVLGADIGQMGRLVRAKGPRRLPVVLTPGEVASILRHLRGPTLLMASILYGSGLRLLECCRLRVKDIDFERREITVRDGKGRKHRVTMLPATLIEPLRRHLARVKDQHERDRERGRGCVELPPAIARKRPDAAREWAWQWVFPATRFHLACGAGDVRRHLHETILRRAFRKAALRAGISKRVSCQTLRHSFATHLLSAGHDIRTIQELLGHSDVSTTMMYVHVLDQGGRRLRSPLDRLV